MILVCTDCLHVCGEQEETFDYSGTHCTNGKSGTHHTGHYVSDCCGAETVELRDFELEHNGRTYKFGHWEKIIHDRIHDWDWWDTEDEDHDGYCESLEACIREIQGE